MAMAKDPLEFYPWYPKDYAVSTTGWTRDQDILYRRLLDYQWTQGRIPQNDNKMIAKIGGFKNNGTFQSAWSVVQKKFKNGINFRMNRERKKAMRIYRAKKKGAKARWQRPGEE